MNTGTCLDACIDNTMPLGLLRLLHTEWSNMTERLAHRDLRNRSAEILRDVAAGASYEITNHGEVVALLTPPAPGGRLRVRRATSRRPFSQIRRAKGRESTQSALDDLRADR